MDITPVEAPDRANAPRKRRGAWLRTMIQWHWISSAICLAGMILFSVTGITLNHAGQIEAKPLVVRKSVEVPKTILATLTSAVGTRSAPLPADLASWLGGQVSRPVGSLVAEWSEDEIYLAMPGPGYDAWLSIDRTSGEVEFESTDRGWIAYLNDLHKARHTGAAWKWFLDLFAVACVIFCLTGLYLLYFHARHRPMTWPVVALGLIIPCLIALLMGHLT